METHGTAVTGSVRVDDGLFDDIDIENIDVESIDFEEIFRDLMPGTSSTPPRDGVFPGRLEDIVDAFALSSLYFPLACAVPLPTADNMALTAVPAPDLQPLPTDLASSSSRGNNLFERQFAGTPSNGTGPPPPTTVNPHDSPSSQLGMLSCGWGTSGTTVMDLATAMDVDDDKPVSSTKTLQGGTSVSQLLAAPELHEVGMRSQPLGTMGCPSRAVQGPMPSIITSTTGPTPGAWNSMKSNIERLYRGHNLPLKDVINLMKTRHGFQASEMMYKKRFRKWGWQKYRTAKRDLRDQQRDPTCLRRLDARTKALLHENTATRLVNKAAFQLRDYVLAAMDNSPTWRTHSRYQVLRASSESWRILNTLEHGLWLLSVEDSSAAWTWIRASFLQLEPVVRALDPFDLFNTTPLVNQFLLVFIRTGRYDILTRYLSFARDLMLSTRGNEQPICNTISTLLELAPLDKNLGTSLKFYLHAIMDICVDIIEERVTGSDKAVLFQKYERAAVTQYLQCGTEAQGSEWKITQVIDETDSFIRSTSESGEASEDDIIGIEYELLSVIHSTNTFRHDYVQRSERLKSTIRARYPGICVSTGEWDKKDVRLYLTTSVRLVRHFLTIKDHQAAFGLLPDIWTVLELDLYNMYERFSYIFWFLEKSLRDNSWTVEAKYLRHCCLEAADTRQESLKGLIEDMGQLEVIPVSRL